MQAWVYGLLTVAFLCITEATIDCTNFPKPIDPHHCCQFPDLFKNNVLEICNAQHKNNTQCLYDCIFTHTEICRKGKCSRNKSDDYIDWVMPPKHPFIDVMKNAYKKCIEKANDMRMNMVQRFDHVGCNPLPEMILLCVQTEMFINCPSDYLINEDIDCEIKREFIKTCVKD